MYTSLINFLLLLLHIMTCIKDHFDRHIKTQINIRNK